MNVYDAGVDNDDIALGERFGFRTCLSQDPGFDYLGGGSGKVFNRKVVEKIVGIGNPVERFRDQLLISDRAETLQADFSGFVLFRRFCSLIGLRDKAQARSTLINKEALNVTYMKAQTSKY